MFSLLFKYFLLHFHEPILRCLIVFYPISLLTPIIFITLINLTIHIAINFIHSCTHSFVNSFIHLHLISLYCLHLFYPFIHSSLRSFLISLLLVIHIVINFSSHYPISIHFIHPFNHSFIHLFVHFSTHYLHSCFHILFNFSSHCPISILHSSRNMSSVIFQSFLLLGAVTRIYNNFTVAARCWTQRRGWLVAECVRYTNTLAALPLSSKQTRYYYTETF